MRVFSGGEFLVVTLRRKLLSWCPFPSLKYQELSFKHHSLDVFAGEYTWRYHKATNEYLLTMKENASSRRHLFAKLVLDAKLPGTMLAKMEIDDKFLPCDEPHSEVVQKLIFLSVVAMLHYEKMREPRHKKVVMDCDCACHCFPGKCTLQKFEGKLKDMFHVTVSEAESDDENLPAYKAQIVF